MASLDSVPAPAWDPIVRITHWSVAAGVLVNGLINDGGSTLHVWIGYSVISLLGLRLLWGFIGPEEARFSSFPFSIRAAVDHLRDMLGGRHTAHRSHNPAGSVMVYALWAMLAVTAATGVLLENAPFPGENAVAVTRMMEHEEDEAEEVVEEVHEIAANLLLILAGLHVAGATIESHLTGRNLVRAMIRGHSTRRSEG